MNIKKYLIGKEMGYRYCIFFRKRKTFRRVYILFFCLLLISVVCKNGRMFFIDDVIRDAFVPINRILSKIGNKVTAIIGFIVSTVDVNAENELLKAKIEELIATNRRLENADRENKRLLEILKLKDRYQGETEVASVIYRDLFNLFDTFVIDKGEKFGIEESMAVICNDGVVGQIISASNNSAVVMQITDARSSIGGINLRTGEPVIVDGSKDGTNICLSYPLTSSGSFEIGDLIITSGIGGIYPKGHLIGEVIKVEKGKYGISYVAQIEPKINFVKLEEVLILLERQYSTDYFDFK